MWYKTGENKLDFSKPIIAEDRETKEQHILLPQVKKDSYKVEGYNWFNLQTGSYASCIFFETVLEALYSRERYKLYNANIIVEEK